MYQDQSYIVVVERIRRRFGERGGGEAGRAQRERRRFTQTDKRLTEDGGERLQQE